MTVSISKKTLTSGQHEPGAISFLLLPSLYLLSSVRPCPILTSDRLSISPNLIFL